MPRQCREQGHLQALFDKQCQAALIRQLRCIHKNCSTNQHCTQGQNTATSLPSVHNQLPMLTPSICIITTSEYRFYKLSPNPQSLSAVLFYLGKNNADSQPIYQEGKKTAFILIPTQTQCQGHFLRGPGFDGADHASHTRVSSCSNCSENPTTCLSAAFFSLPLHIGTTLQIPMSRQSQALLWSKVRIPPSSTSPQ